MGKRDDVVYVVIDDEGKLQGVYADAKAAQLAKDACDGIVCCRAVE